MTRLPNRHLVVAITVLLSLNLAHGDDPCEPEGDKQDSGELTQKLVDDIAMIGIREDGSRYRLCRPQLLMEIFDPERGRDLNLTQTGALWAWGDGRPLAITEVWRWKGAGSWGYTFISTTPGYVTASIENKTWKPEQPGLHFTELQNAPVPAETTDEFTRQMGQIVGRFTGYEMLAKGVADLRMLPDPLHRYEEDGVRGAIFMLAHNDNPEAILFLESVTDPARPNYWRYAWSKATSAPVTIKLDGKEIHNIPGSLYDQGSESGSFWVFFRQMLAKR